MALSAIQLALMALAAAQENDATQDAAILAAFEKPVKAPKEKKERKIKEPKAKPIKVPEFFPEADPLDHESFLVAINAAYDDRGNADVMGRLSLCHGFVAWLKNSEYKRYMAQLSPAMAPGALLDAIRLVIVAIQDPSFTAATDYSNRDGTVVVFGSAGLGSKADKMRASLTGLMIAANNASKEHVCNARAKAELAKIETDDSEAQVLRNESAIDAGMAAIEYQRARNIRSILDNADHARMAQLYEAMGAREVPVVETIAVNMGSFGKYAKGTDGSLSLVVEPTVESATIQELVNDNVSV